MNSKISTKISNNRVIVKYTKNVIIYKQEKYYN